MNQKSRFRSGKIGFVTKISNDAPLASAGGFFVFIILVKISICIRTITDTFCIYFKQLGVDFGKITCNNNLYDT